MGDGVDVTGHGLGEKLRVGKLPRGEVVVQSGLIAHGGDYSIAGICGVDACGQPALLVNRFSHKLFQCEMDQWDEQGGGIDKKVKVQPEPPHV